MHRFTYYLLVGLVTFSISVAITSAFILSVQIPRVEVIDNTIVSAPHFIESYSDKGEIEIKYKESLEGVDLLEAIFTVKNNTPETVYFFGYSKTNNRDSWIKQKGKIQYSEIPEGVEITEQELKPNELTYFWIIAPLNGKPFEAGFILRTGDKRKEQKFEVKVKQHISPIFCIRKGTRDWDVAKCGTRSR